MNLTNGRFLVDERGEPTAVLLDIDEYRRQRDALEELEVVQAYDEAKRRLPDHLRDRRRARCVTVLHVGHRRDVYR